MTDRTNPLELFSKVIDKQFKEAIDKRNKFMGLYADNKEVELPDSAHTLHTLLSRYSNIIAYGYDRMIPEQAIEELKQLKTEILKMVK